MRRLLIVLTISVLVHLYVFFGYKVLLNGLPSRTAFLAKAGYWVLIGIAYLALFAAINGFREAVISFWTKAAISFFFIILVIHLVAIVFLALDDILRLFRWIVSLFQNPEIRGEGISRKTFIVKTGALVATSFGAALTYGVVKGSHRYQVVRQKLVIPNLPDGLKGLKIVQISDIHSGSFWSQEGVQKGIDLIKEQGADLVFFTGDLVNNLASEMDEYIDMFRQITAPMGVYSTLGNHDYGEYVPGFKPEDLPRNVEAMKQIHKSLGWNLLMNQHVVLEKNSDKLAVVGIENWGKMMRFSRYGDLAKAVEGLDEKLPTLLLSHDPSHWRGQVLPDYPQIDVAFAGHTHGMQFGIETGGWKWSPVKYVYPEWAGLYQEGHQQLYVNRGFGYLGFPGRLGIWPEITVFELA